MPDSKTRLAFAEAARYFQTPLQQFQFFDKYARFNHAHNRRETWPETVDRVVTFLRELSHNRLADSDYLAIQQAILRMDVMPSMRALAMAGEAARRQNLALYNCSALPVDSFDSFVEALIISMSGCGVGFSVERQFVDRLPPIAQHDGSEPSWWVIEDTTEGWADALRFGLTTWAAGKDVQFDYRLIRPAGSILRVKGGRASGPEPLRNLLTFARTTLMGAAGRTLTPLECHDLMCVVGSAAVSGGVRRTAMLSLFDFDDQTMALCKHGEFPSYRWNANNTAVWPERRLSFDEVAAIMHAMDAGQRGEPGIFSRKNAKTTAPARRTRDQTYLVNPCSEILLRPFGLCNLSSIVARPDDTFDTLAEKARIATMIGTIQSMATHFPGLRPEWKKNAEEERLLGVSLDGQLDSVAAQDPLIQERLRDLCVEVNKEYAAKLGINQSAAVTCVKPSGNSSQLLNCASGLHARWAPYYIRNVRVSTHSPVYRVLKACGVPMDPENGQTAAHADTWVVHFPIKAPEGAITRKDRSALAQCDYWLQNKIRWTEHNPSVTITYRPEELDGVIQWVYDHQDVIGGMAFLPAFDAQYAQMPYEEITREEYERLAAAFPPIDFSLLVQEELEDHTTAAQELACMAGVCEL